MFDKKLPCYFDYDRDSENYLPYVNGITIGNLNKFKTEILGISDGDNNLSYIQLGLPNQFFVNSTPEDDYRSYDPASEPFIYPIKLEPRLSRNYANGHTKVFWNEYIHIHSTVLDKVKNNHGKICLFNNWEAWPADSYLYIAELLIAKYSKWNLSMYDFIISTCNSKIADDNNIPLSVINNLTNITLCHPSVAEKVVNDIKLKKPRKHKFICLNRITKPHRLASLSELWEDRSEGLLSAVCGHYGTPGLDEFANSIGNSVVNAITAGFNNPAGMEKIPDSNDWEEYARKMILETSMNWNYTTHFEECYPESYKKYTQHELINKLPIMLPNDHSPILNPVPDPLAQKFFDSSLNIVTETYGLDSDASVFLTEKVWKPILHYQPFVIIGASGYLSELKRLGFNTFDAWLNEDYDNIENDQERLVAAISSAKSFYNRPKIDIAEDLFDMIDVLLHNVQNYQELYDTNCVNVLSQIAFRLNYCTKET
jgi:hypothetical protein